MAKLIVGVNDLATINPELAKEWDYDKNEKTPQEYAIGSHEKVWWIGKCGHKWQAELKSRNMGNGCPYCSGRKVLIGFNDLLSVNPALAEEWNYDKNVKLPQEYTSSSGQKVWWKCKIGHEWESTIDNRRKGNNCPYCAGKQVLRGFNDVTTINPKLASEWNYDKNDKSPQNYTVGSNKKVWWKCEKGHEWLATIASRNQGNNCPVCSNYKIIVGINDLVTTNPKLVSEWNYDKNDKSPQEYISGSNQKVWWVCEKGHEWSATIVSRTQGNGCPYCSNKKVLIGYNDLLTVNSELAKEWNYEKNEKTPQDYTSGSNVKVWWKCKNGHEWQVSIVSRTIKNIGCPYCSGRYAIQGKTDLATLRPNLVKEWNYEKNDTMLPRYYKCGSGQKVWWKCEKGHEWKAIIYERALKGLNCPYCSNHKILKGFNDLETLNPSLVKEWNYEKNDKLPSDYSVNNGNKVWWKCNKGHEWQATIASRNSGCGCPYCSGRYPIKGQTDLKTVFPDVAVEWNYEKNDKKPDEYTSVSPRKVWWKCSNGHEWKATIAHRTKGNQGCPYCNGSKAERLVYKILKEWNIPFKAEKKFESDLRVKYYPYDVWISKYGLLIECDGMQHFKEVEYFEQNKPFDERIKTDNIKNQFAFEKRIPLLRIPYTYNPDTEEEKIRQLLKEFIETRKVPQESIDFYAHYPFSNYAELATNWNAHTP